MRKHTILRNILIDLVCAGLALVVFALFHHVLPRQQQSLGIVITNPYLNESPEGDAGGSLPEGLDDACAAADEGVAYTKTIAATKGRASYLGERSIGHQDPGATSAAITLGAIRDFIKG